MKVKLGTQEETDKANAEIKAVAESADRIIARHEKNQRVKKWCTVAVIFTVVASIVIAVIIDNS